MGRQLSPAAGGRQVPAQGWGQLEAAACIPCSSCLHWGAIEPGDRGVARSTRVSLGCPKPWEQREGAGLHAACYLCCRHQGANISTRGVVAGPVLQWSWQVSATCLHPPTGLPERACAASPKLLHGLMPVTRRDAIHPSSITPGWLLWTTGRSTMKWVLHESSPGQPRVTATEEVGDNWEGDSGLYACADMEGEGPRALPTPSTLSPGSSWRQLD